MDKCNCKDRTSKYIAYLEGVVNAAGKTIKAQAEQISKNHSCFTQSDFNNTATLEVEVAELEEKVDMRNEANRIYGESFNEIRDLMDKVSYEVERELE